MYCINCFNGIEDNCIKCRHCGYDYSKYEINNRALRPLTILAGKYMIGRIIGEGGFGITYLGFDLNLKMRVAVKEYFPAQLATRNTAEGGTNSLSVIGGEYAEYFKKGYTNYEKEARRLASLENLPGIVHVLNFFYENNTAYMVMEYIQGKSLKDIIKEKNGGLSWKTTLELMEPVIKSLSVVHKSGIIHRDISPDNIMQREDGRIVLIDFGAAREMNNDGKSKTIELKRGYAPPEQYQTQGNQGTWTDVYALCATIYRLICGHPLPDAMSLYTGNSTIQPIHEQERSFPKTLDAAIMKGLSPRIDDRIKDMDELYTYLYGGRKVIPWKKIRYGVIFAASLVVLAIILGVVINSVGKSRQESDTKDRYTEEEDEDDSRYEKKKDEPTTSVKDDNGSSEDTADEQQQISEDTAGSYIQANGLTYTDVNLIQTEDNGNGLTVTSTDYTAVDIVIPEEINGKKVTAISGIGSNVTQLVLPDTVTAIEANAFKNCVYMESIYIPSGVTEIGNNAFENCASLEDIHISAQNEKFYVEGGKIKDREGKTYN